MPTRNQINLPPPTDWQELQRLITDLYKKIWNNEYVQQFGSSGQAQHGIDICGFPNSEKKIEGIQCKCVVSLKANDVKNEYEKSLNFPQKLSRFILVTTTKTNTQIQEKAMQLTMENQYPCEVVFWENICQYLSEYPDITRKYYPDSFIIESISDSPGKLIKIDISVNHYELLISKINPEDEYYGSTILVSDLQNRKCITYHLGGHWSRLKGIVGITSCDAFLLSKWLNTFEDIDSILKLGKTTMLYIPSTADHVEAQKEGFVI